MVLECGGKNPAVVLRDAEDLDAVAQHVVNGAFWKMGDPLDPAHRVGSMVSKAHFEKVRSYIE